MPSANFTHLTRHLAKADIDFDTVTCKVMLVSAEPTETQLDTWVTRSDVTTEITGTGYTAGGISQPYTLNSLDTTNNRQTITYTDRTNGWTNATFTARGAIIYQDTGNASTDRLMHFVDFGSNVSCTNGNFSITYTSPFAINRS